MARAATLEESIQFLNVLLVENPGDRAAALAALPDLGPQDSGTEDASNASNSPLPLPRYLPRIDLSNLGDLTPGLAIIEEWTKYIPAAEVFVKCIRVWPSEAAPLSRSPTMIVAVNYLRNNRLDWSRWPLDRACFRLTRLKIGARTVMRASKLQTNFTRVSARKSKKQSRVVPQRRKGAAANPEKVKVTMNLKTYKFHSLGDYLHFIPWFGTSDSYSTQTGELEHRRVKRFYARTNKNTAVRQMTILERREQALLHIARKLGKILPSPPPQPHTKGKRKAGAKRKVKKSSLHVDFLESETLPYTAPEQHHHISASRNFHTNIPQFLHENEGDPAVQDFLPKLKNHLLGRLAHPDYSDDTEEFTDEERHSLVIANNRMYRHKVLRVNYTTYDVRRGQDSMNPRTRADIMTLAPQGDTSHPFSYARLLSVFHVDVIRNVRGATHVPVPTSLDVLWVRNFRRDTSFRAGFKAKRLHRLEFIPADQPNAFSFLNPDEVIRGAHLIPAFHHGRTHDLLGEGPSLALDDEDMGEWRYHYVNMFVDRDMYMRYVGGGIGHYKVEVDNEVGTAGDGEDIGLGPEGDSESEDVGEVNSGAAEGEDGASVVPGDGDEVDDSEKRVGSESGSDSEDSQGSGASTTDDDGDDDGGEGSDTESSVDLGAEDGEGYMEEEEEEGYAPL